MPHDQMPMPMPMPMPGAVAARPRDARGYPVLAITPWRDGVPDFAVTSPARILVCAVERRCSICALPLGKGPVWRVVSADEAVALAAARAVGPGADSVVGTVEPPGHELCMTYAAVVCPWLARPNARRRFEADGIGVAMTRGDARGSVGDVGGALVSFARYEFSVGARVEFRYRELDAFRPHLLGADHLESLRAGTETESPVRDEAPPWLQRDEAVAQERALRYL